MGRFCIKSSTHGLFEHPSLQGIDICAVHRDLENLSDNKWASIALSSTRKKTSIQPRGGFPTFEKQKSLLNELVLAGADFLPLTIDSHTRQGDYHTAEALLQRSEETGDDHLNGYPLVAHGYRVTRELHCEIPKPVSLRHGTPDARLLVANAIAAGITEIEGGGLTYLLPYSARFPVDQSLVCWRIIDELCAEFSQPGRLIHRESFGVLTANLVPPVLVIVVEVLELLLAVEAGIKSFSLSYGQTGNTEQDIALAQALKFVADQELNRREIDDVDIYLVYHHWMGPFPENAEDASNIISVGTAISSLVGADKVVTKTKDEALGIPRIENNCESVRQVMKLLKFLAPVPLFSTNDNEEADHMIAGARSILDKILSFNPDSLIECVSKAVCDGLIDIPFSPHRENRNKVVALRDQLGAIRIYEQGALPLPSEFATRERELLKGNRKLDPSIADRVLADIEYLSHK